MGVARILFPPIKWDMGMQLPQQSHGRQPSPPTDDPPLHPKIRSIVSLALAHTQKTYFSGPLIHKFERNPDGKPHKDEGWREVWAQLSGTTLCIWDMEEVKIANQQGREVPPVVYKHHGSRASTLSLVLSARINKTSTPSSSAS